MKPRHLKAATLPPWIVEELAAAVPRAELPMEQRSRMRARILERIDDAVPEGTRTLRDHDSEWIEIAPFIEARILCIDDVQGTHTSMMRMRPGGVVPAHQHSKAEEFIVLAGECHIGTHRLAAGDVQLSEPGSWHGPVTTREGVLVLLRGEYPFPHASEHP
jgi:quercetin dioxygenase-like cupin family protein